MAVHPTAILEDGAVLGADVEVGPYCVVGPNVRLEDGVRLISHVMIGGHTTIGARTVVHPFAVLGGEGQIRGNDSEGAGLSIGQDCVLREYVNISLGSKKGHNLTKVGDRCFFMANTHAGHDCVIGNDVTIANGTVLAGHVTVGDNVIFGGLAAVQQFIRIGRGAMLGGLSGANNDIIPFVTAMGMHSKLAGLNIIGLKRRGVPRPNIHALRHAFKAVMLSEEGSLRGRVAAARAEWGCVPEVGEVLDFIEAPAKHKIAPARRHGAPADDE